MHFPEGHGMIRKSLIARKIALNEAWRQVLLEAFSLARDLFKLREFHTWRLCSIGSVVQCWLKKTFPLTRARSNLLSWCLFSWFYDC